MSNVVDFTAYKESKLEKEERIANADKTLWYKLVRQELKKQGKYWDTEFENSEHLWFYFGEKLVAFASFERMSYSIQK